MKIVFLTSGDITVASSRTRIYQYLPYFENNNDTYKVLKYSHRQNLSNTNKNIRLLIYLIYRNLIYRPAILKFLLFFALCNDIVFIQKVVLPVWYIKILRIINKNIVFDFDDAIYTGHRLLNYSVKRYRKRLNYILKISKLIIVESKQNFRYAESFNKNVISIIGPIDTDRYNPVNQPEKDDIFIGWIGSPTTAELYLKPILPELQKLKEKYLNVNFKFIGSELLQFSKDSDSRHFERSQEILFIQVEWNLYTEVQELSEFDIGIMPIDDNEWTRGKGGYKLLQYMSMGIPCVASNVGINSTLIEDGKNGYLINNDNEWYEKLSILIENKNLRNEMSMRNRQKMLDYYSYDTAFPKLYSELQNILFR